MSGLWPLRSGSGGGGWLVERRPLDLTGLERLDDVAFLDVIEAVEQDSALEAFGDFARIILEPLELGDRRLVDDRPVADDTCLRGAADDAARDHAAGNRSQPRDLEEGTYLRLAERLFLLDGLEHPDERLLDVLGELVDDAVRTDLDAFTLRKRSGFGIRSDVEPDHSRAGGRGEHDVALGDAAHALVDDVHAHLRVLDLGELGDGRFDGPDHIALEDEIEVLNRAGLDLLEETLHRDAPRSRCKLFASQPLAARICKLARATLVLDHASELTGRRWLVESEDLDGIARAGVLHLVAAEVVEGTDLAPGVAGDDRISDVQCPAVDQHRCDRAATDVETRLDDRAGRLGGRV